jgi:outer membrane protein assembly factor BamA
MLPAVIAMLSLLSAAQQTVTAIQVHGNTVTADDDVRRLAGIDIGAPVDENTIAGVAERLRATRRFERVEVLKRFASIDDPSQILLVIIVDEGPVTIERGGDATRPPRVVRSHRMNLLFLPVVGREDGYGFTYGVQLARPGVAGAGSRLSFPVTWGGEKKAGLEINKSIRVGPIIDRITAGASLSRRTNPFYREDDDRGRVWARGERRIAPVLRAGATVEWQRASFFDTDDRFLRAGADVTLDTRIDPVLPRNAIYVRGALERMTVADGVTRTELDARGYLGLIGQSVLALRLLRHDSSGPLPPYLKPLLGGMANLRGFAAGTAAGDSLLATSAEAILPLTSPLSIGKIGVSVFTDAGTAYEYGARLSDQTLKRGYGGSVWFTAALLRLNLAVAHGRGSSTRVHVGGTVTF